MLPCSCSRVTIEFAAIQGPPKSKEWGFCNGQHLYSEKGSKFWDEISLCLLPHATQEPPDLWLNRLCWIWQADATQGVMYVPMQLSQKSLSPTRAARSEGSSEGGEFVLELRAQHNANTHSNFFWIRSWWRQWRTVCVPVFSYTFCFRTTRELISVKWYSAWNPSKLLVLAHHSAICSIPSLTWMQTIF